MANRAKRDADEAFAWLRNRLCLDKDVLGKLGDIERFLGGLRREKSDLKLALDASEQSRKLLQEKDGQYEQQMADTRLTIEKINARCRQAESDVKAAEQRMAVLREQSSIAGSWDAKLDPASWWRVFRTICIRLPKPPAPVDVIADKGDFIYVFDLNDLRASGTDDYSTIGLLVFVALGLFPRIAFVDSRQETQSDRPGTGIPGRLTNKQLDAFMKWCGEDWFVPELRQQLTNKLMMKIAEDEGVHFPPPDNPGDSPPEVPL